MEKQWFTEPAPRRSRALFTVVGSVILHGSIIAVAALWPVRYEAPAKPPLITVLSDAPAPGEIMPLPPTSAEASLTPPAESEPAPPTVDASTDAPPSPEDLPLTEPVPPRPAPRAAVSRTHPPRVSSTVPASGGTPGQPGATNTAPGAIGTAGRWHTPQPPYPYAMRAARAQGSGSVRITTDASGRVVNASVVQSTGNPVLDGNTSQFARTNWSGPPNASITVPITYQMR